MADLDGGSRTSTWSTSSSNRFAALEGAGEEIESELVQKPPPVRPPRKVKDPLVWIDLEMTGK